MTAEPGTGPTRTVFETLAWLYAPAEDPWGCAIIEADDRWRVDEAGWSGALWAVWGRPASRARGPARLARFAVAREIGIRRIGGRSLGGMRCWDLHRLPPVSRPGRWRQTVRSLLMSGALARLGRSHPGNRVADAVAELAGDARTGPVELRPSGDGSALARIRGGGADYQLRLATIGGLKDPRRNAAALERLGALATPSVPRLVASGEALGTRWSTETQLPGSAVRRLTPALAADLVAWCASLPRADGPATAAEDRLRLIAGAFPRWAPELAGAADALRSVGGEVRGMLTHGDLWIGNVLASDGRLGGVIDWDTWHPAGMPGSDLLHLVAMERRARTGRELGELWLERPWADDGFLELTGPYWRAIGLPPSPELLWAVAVDWWAAHVAAALRRGRRPTADPDWVSRNVDNVAALLALRGVGPRSAALAAAPRT